MCRADESTDFAARIWVSPTQPTSACAGGTGCKAHTAFVFWNRQKQCSIKSKHSYQHSALWWQWVLGPHGPHFSPHLHCTPPVLTLCPTPPHWCLYSQLGVGFPIIPLGFYRSKSNGSCLSLLLWASSRLLTVISQLNTFLDPVCMHSLQYLIRDLREPSY